MLKILELESLADKEWWSRNKYEIAAVVASLALSTAIGLVLTRYRLDLDNTIFKRSDLVKYFNQGKMRTIKFESVWHDAANFGNMNPLKYVSPSITFAKDKLGNPTVIEEFGERLLTTYESNIVYWHNIGGGYIEHLGSLAIGLGIFGYGKYHKHKKKKIIEILHKQNIISNR